MTPMAAAAHNCGSWLTQAKAGAQAGWNMTDPEPTARAGEGWASSRSCSSPPWS